MIKQILAAVLISGLSFTGSFGQASKNLVGTWEGKLNAGVELTVVFHINDNGSGGLIATADSPDQSSYDMRCDSAYIHEGTLVIELRNLQASFSGRQTNDSTIEGKFKQGVEMPLTLHRKKNGSAPPADVSVPANVKSADVTVQQKGAILSGTYFQPLNDDKSTAILIIAGSGPTDRNGNNPLLPGKNNSLLQLADSLAAHGVATLRYDKRGIGKSKMPPGVGQAEVTIDDIAADARAMFEWLRSNGYKSVLIAGHSEGSLIGLMIAANVKAAGFISIAGAGRRAGDILKEQMDGQLPPATAAELNKAIDSLEQGFTVKKIDPALISLLHPSVQPYMRSWLKQDPQKLIAQLQCPVLIVQGTNDLQIKEVDAQDLKTAQPKATLVLIKNMNHVMKEVKSSDAGENKKAYSDPALPVVHPLVQAIVQFIVRSTAQ